MQAAKPTPLIVSTPRQMPNSLNILDNLMLFE
jgi:hypothetical protein